MLPFNHSVINDHAVVYQKECNMIVTKYFVEGGDDEPESTNSQPVLVLVLHCMEHCG